MAQLHKPIGCTVFWYTEGGTELYGHVVEYNIQCDEEQGMYLLLEVETLKGTRYAVKGSDVTNYWQ